MPVSDLDLAQRIAWWKDPRETLANRTEFLARVMAQGSWEDWCAVLEREGKDAFRNALEKAAPGIFDARSWAYWRIRLGLPPAPLPIRRFET